VAHAGATALGLIRCTNPHTVTVIYMHHSQHPAPTTRGGFGLKRKAHGARGLGGPPRPASPTTSNQPVLQPAQPGPGSSAPPAEYLWC
jgi:hypothetical protein